MVWNRRNDSRQEFDTIIERKKNVSFFDQEFSSKTFWLLWLARSCAINQLLSRLKMHKMARLSDWNEDENLPNSEDEWR